MSDEYAHDLNVGAKFGMHGKLAVAYAEMLQAMRDAPASRLGGGRAHAPRDFKRVVGRFEPAFAKLRAAGRVRVFGQAAQGLGEDLNHVAEKPYAELPDGDGVPDWELAAARWANHKKREDHPVTAAFTGMQHSQMVCSVSGERA